MRSTEGASSSVCFPKSVTQERRPPFPFPSVTVAYFFRFRRHDFIPNPKSGVATARQMIGVRVGAGGVVLDERQPDRLMAKALEVVFARSVRWQRVSGAVQQSPVGVVGWRDDELALARVFCVALRFVVHE